jgi:hypothetical protein
MVGIDREEVQELLQEQLTQALKTLNKKIK